MSSSSAPKQGDHVFNAMDLALIRPFKSIISLQSADVDGQHFVHDYLLHCYSLAKKMSETRALASARTFVATASAEETALRELTRLRPRYPSLARVTAQALRSLHARNSDQFGDAAVRYEREFLTLVRQCLETALAAGGSKAPVRSEPTVSIACQQMIGASYDPAAALVVIVNSSSAESVAIQGLLYPTIIAVAERLDRPMMWREAYSTFTEARPSVTGRLIADVRDTLTQMDLVKAQSMTFPALIKDEISNKSRSAADNSRFGAMLHLLHARLQQMQ